MHFSHTGTARSYLIFKVKHQLTSLGAKSCTVKDIETVKVTSHQPWKGYIHILQH